MKRIVAIVVVNVGALAALVVAFVLISNRLWPERIQTLGAADFVRKDRLLGHRPGASMQSTGMLRIGDEVIYDVTYTTDEHGLRVSPPGPVGDDAPCVLFFGGSFTFGEGVEDQEAMPYRVGVRAGGRYAVRNFGFAGYGPHHMLAAIEGGFVADAVDCRPRAAIYLAIHHHNLRAAGKWWWDRYGPRYVLEQGQAVRYGNFHDPDVDVPWSEAIREGPDLTATDVTQGDIRLLYAIVSQSRERLAEMYPGIEFHVIYWDKGQPPLFGSDWDPAMAPVHPVSAILRKPEHPDRWQREYTLAGDVHPNARAHDAIAAYVVETILDEEGMQ